MGIRMSKVDRIMYRNKENKYKNYFKDTKKQ